jgi:XisI protein
METLDKPSRKATRYRKLVQKICADLAAYIQRGFKRQPQIHILFVQDMINGHFLIFRDGWLENQRDYGCFCHFEVKNDGKIWFRYNGTDLDLVQELLDAKIPKSDIVLAFLPAELQQDKTFAIMA